jgi:hypothetical protein
MSRLPNNQRTPDKQHLDCQPEYGLLTLDIQIAMRNTYGRQFYDDGRDLPVDLWLQFRR